MIAAHSGEHAIVPKNRRAAGFQQIYKSDALLNNHLHDILRGTRGYSGHEKVPRTRFASVTRILVLIWVWRSLRISRMVAACSFLAAVKAADAAAAVRSRFLNISTSLRSSGGPVLYFFRRCDALANASVWGRSSVTSLHTGHVGCPDRNQLQMHVAWNSCPHSSESGPSSELPMSC